MSYDSWLEAPYQDRYAQEPAAEIQDLLGQQVVKDGEHGVIDDYECWEDADEDGRYSGVDFVVKYDGATRRENLTPEQAEQAVARAMYHIDERMDGSTVYKFAATPTEPVPAARVFDGTQDECIDWIEQQVV